MRLPIVAVDLAKNTFEVAIVDQAEGQPRFKRLSRGQFERFIAHQPVSRFVVEACPTAQFWCRQLAGLGHDPRMLPAQYVASYRRRNKTDRADTKALLEADRAPDIQPVSVKTAEQQAIQQLHGVREQLVTARTAWINQARGILREQGFAIAQGAHKARQAIPEIIEDADNGLPDALREVLFDIVEHLRGIDERIQRIEHRLNAYKARDADAQRLSELPGIGLITSTALTSCVADIRQFDKPRQFAAWLGLTPREHSSGDRRQLGGISKRGNRYLRQLLIHGSRSALMMFLRKARRGEALDAFEQWAVRTYERVGFNKAVVGVANKLARRIVAICRDNSSYEPDTMAPAAA